MRSALYIDESKWSIFRDESFRFIFCVCIFSHDSQAPGTRFEAINAFQVWYYSTYRHFTAIPFCQENVFLLKRKFCTCFIVAVCTDCRLTFWVIPFDSCLFVVFRVNLHVPFVFILRCFESTIWLSEVFRIFVYEIFVILSQTNAVCWKLKQYRFFLIHLPWFAMCLEMYLWWHVCHQHTTDE